MNFKDYKKKALQDPEVKESYYNYEIGNLITLARLEKNIHQKDLAEKLRIAPSTLSKIENGRRDCKVGELRKIAKYLGKRLVISFVDL